jgi:type III restriction enzyme
MRLKTYQAGALEVLRGYLTLLAEWRDKARGLPELCFPETAWEKAGIPRAYHKRKDGLGRHLPAFCLKIPTGGGKTLLAVKAVDLAHSLYLKRRAGLVLWIVPSNAIYTQTLRQLKDKAHPYRQFLDMTGGGHTMIVEKTDRFTPRDVEENLTVLLLMLPSAARRTKETLRMFQDSGGFQAFFPPDDNLHKQEDLLSRVKNLDTFEKTAGFWGRQVKTSLGNTLRLLNPLVILDEGHKAYSELAQETLRNFNPSLILELSATPDPERSNILVDIPGRTLNDEEMIKLDLHMINKAGLDWKDALRSAFAKRNELERKAVEHEARTGIYIRPICLIQVERTGKDQRHLPHIHSEDVRERLTRVLGALPEHVAVKTSETDELKDLDQEGGLLSRDCHVRFIITKRALQEGWDCSFAYVLAILTNPDSKNALTQLVGRILRQPYARKTHVKELDESYVYCFQQRAGELIDAVKKGFESEGLGDLAGRVHEGDGSDDAEDAVTAEIRERFRKAASRTFLPIFVVKDGKKWRPVGYETDLSPKIPWDQVDLSRALDVTPTMLEEKDAELVATLSDDPQEVIRQKKGRLLPEGGLRVDPVFMGLQLSDIVPNPWLARHFAEKTLAVLSKKLSQDVLTNGFVGVIEHLRDVLAEEKDRLAEAVFRGMLAENKLRFLVISRDINFTFRPTTQVSKPFLTKKNGTPLQLSLFDPVPEDQFNPFERDVAWLLEDHNKMFFWYRNQSKRDYAVQGWRSHKVYPDFIFTATNKTGVKEYEAVYVVETKGEHLLGSNDTDYKKKLFAICNEKAVPGSWNELGLKDKSLRFEVLPSAEWEQRLRLLMEGAGDPRERGARLVASLGAAPVVPGGEVYGDPVAKVREDRDR